MVNSRSEDPANIDRVPCAACSNPSECEVWTTPVCYPCAADWQSRAPTYGDIADKYGPDADNVAVYKAFTERWLGKRKGVAA
jgi:hypothetical protein